MGADEGGGHGLLAADVRDAGGRRLTIDTIFATSSGRPPAAIAVIRISGPAAPAALSSLAGTLPAPRRASLRTLRGADGGILDRALVILFPGPATATGEDLVELHCHGGRAVVAVVEEGLAAMPTLRLALPGEFTRRAVTNGRLDLVEAEGLAGLLEAETETQRRAAMMASEGRVSRQVHRWLDETATLSAMVEALLDFADEDDVAVDLTDLRRRVGWLADDMAASLAAPSVDRLRDGVRVVLGGPPNSGKSTLLNLMTERDAAIVSPVSGTTRDRIEAPVTRGGVAYLLVDTAGLTGTDDAIEAEGVARAGTAIAAADILVWLGDDPPPRDDALWVHSRADLPARAAMPDRRDLAISEQDASSIKRLWEAVAGRAGELLPATDAVAFKTGQRGKIKDAVDALRVDDGDMLVMAEGLRLARRSLAALLGLDVTEVMLDALFGRFCLGK